MHSQEIPSELEVYAMRLHRTGSGKYVPVTSGDGVKVFFVTDSQEASQVAIDEMRRRKNISDSLKKKPSG